MVFGQNQNFFLTLDAEAPNAELAMDEAPAAVEEADKQPAPEMSLTVAVAEDVATPSPAVTSAPEPTATETPAAVTAAPTEAETAPAPVAAASLTTAEAIAAELAAAEAAKPAVTFSTYAPDRLVAGSGLPTRRRRPGASMKSFRGLASDLFKS